MDKKGISEQMVQWIPRMLFLALVIVVIMALVKSVVVQYEDTSTARAYVYMNKMLYDKDGIIRFENSRAYPGVIDYDKFTSQRLDAILAVDPEKESPTAQLVLKEPDGKLIRTIYWNGNWFERLRPKGIFRGPGAPASVKDVMRVTIYRNNKLEPAILEMHVLVPK
ncbi:hypothetical protein KY311_04490 [Candidatus Woesearchaeota archaeon]|nr:hypothetical protein [Candidatus Woesearchaeota archaeon]